MTRVTVRPLADDDDLDALDDGNPLAWMTAWWRNLPELEFHWYVALLDDEPVGLGAVAPLPIAAGGCGAGVLNVIPRARRGGVATTMRRTLEDKARGRVPGVVYTYLAGDPDAEAATRAWALQEVGRHHESVLDLASVDRALLSRKADVPELVVATLGPLEAIDQDEWTALHGFVQDRFREAPDSAEGGGLLPFDVFRGLIREPWMLMTAHLDGVLVGVTLVVPRPGRTDATNTFFTGVLPEARGRGIATALKAAQALTMADLGIVALYTQNMDGNEPILAANRTLGFRRGSVHVDVLAPTADTPR
jgi:GNAT superfamily N-acetyltransferase